MIGCDSAVFEPVTRSTSEWMHSAAVFDIADDIVIALRAVTKVWAKQRKQEERHAADQANRLDRLLRSRRETQKEVAWECMEAAYLAASSNVILPAAARQVMYAARTVSQERTDKQLDDQYFTQTLLPDYMEEHDVDWDVVFDDRDITLKAKLRSSDQSAALRVGSDLLIENDPERVALHYCAADLYLPREASFLPLDWSTVVIGEELGHLGLHRFIYGHRSLISGPPIRRPHRPHP